jgi:hypothetical protein
MAFPVLDPETGMEAIAEEVEETEMANVTKSLNRHRLVLGATVISLGLVAAVVGGVCGSGHCRSRSTTSTESRPQKTGTTTAAATTPFQPTTLPSQIPSPSPSDATSLEPSDIPSTQPASDTPSSRPSSIPSEFTAKTPSLRPSSAASKTLAATRRPTTRVPSSNAPTVSSPSVASDEDCHLKGCYIRNLDSGVETQLNPSLIYQGSTTSRYSIRCDTIDTNVEFIDYYLAGSSVLHHREYEAPFWMQSNSDSWIEPVPYLSVCDNTTSIKTVRVAAAPMSAVTTTDYCIDVSFQWMFQCQDEEPLLDATTTSSAAAPQSVVASSEEDTQEYAMSNDCNMECYLRNLETGVEISLLEKEATVYSVAANGSSRYSIRCDPKSEMAHHVDFIYNQQNHHEYIAPYWMQSNSDDWIEPVTYLSECGGSFKTVRIALATDDNDDEKYCWDVSFDLKAEC